MAQRLISMLNHMNLDKKDVLKKSSIKSSYNSQKSSNRKNNTEISFNIQKGHLDFTAFENLTRVCSNPFKQHTNADKLILPPSASESL